MLSVRVLTMLVTHFVMGTTRNFWLSSPCLRKAMRVVPFSIDPYFKSITKPSSLLIVKSSSKCHFWLSPPCPDHMIISPVSLAPAISRASLKAENDVVNFSENHRLLCTIKNNFANEEQYIYIYISTGL